MALRKVYFGSVGPFVYDDAVPVNDPDGDFAGEDHKSITTDGQLCVEQAPAADGEVLRLIDLKNRILPPVSVVNIANPTELNSVSGELGVLVLAYQIIGAAGQNEYTVYAYDASGPAVNSPYVVDADGAGSERWIAIAGKYAAQALNLTGVLTVLGGQIVFPATQAPSGDVNTLDDYEEGYHVATITCSISGSYTINASYNTLAYTKIGRHVHVQGTLIVTSENAPNGFLRISLPFTATNLSEYSDAVYGVLILQGHGGNLPGLSCSVVGGRAYLELNSLTDAGVLTALNDSHVDTAFNLAISIDYICE